MWKLLLCTLQGLYRRLGGNGIFQITFKWLFRYFVHPKLALSDCFKFINALIQTHSNCTRNLPCPRSYHHKILSAHFKSLPALQDTDKISDVTSSIQKCQVCINMGHFLHKYCTNKCSAFLDAVSLQN